MPKRVTKAEAKRLEKNAKQRARRAKKKGEPVTPLAHAEAMPPVDGAAHTPTMAPPHINDEDSWRTRVPAVHYSIAAQGGRDEVAEQLRRSHFRSSPIDRYVRHLADLIESNGLA